MFNRKGASRVLALGAATGMLVAGLTVAPSAWSYQPSAGTIYAPTSEELGNRNKANPTLYPKLTVAPSGRYITTFERSIGDVVGQTMWLYTSDDHGTSWAKTTEVQAPAYVTDDPALDKYTSMWTNPYLYTMPETIGDLTEGTVLLAAVVSGDDPCIEEGCGYQNGLPYKSDRKDVALALYTSSDEGASWKFHSIIADGGYYGDVYSTENAHKQTDPIWEPFIMVYEGQLVVYYSDENEYKVSENPRDAEYLTEASDNDTASDPRYQILAHKTYDGKQWSRPVADDLGQAGNGLWGSGRPGMTTVVPTSDGRWMMTYEFWGTGSGNWYKIADSPLEFGNTKSVANVSAFGLPGGGSPVMTYVRNGANADGTPRYKIFYNSMGSGDVFVNETGIPEQGWKKYHVTVGSGYSRNLTYDPNTGRMVIVRGGWGGGPITYATVDFGQSNGSYWKLVNKKTGQALDANGTADSQSGDVMASDVDDSNDDQFWHVVVKSDEEGTGRQVTFLSKSGGRALGTWSGASNEGAKLSRWVDDAQGGTENDKLWILDPVEGEETVRIKSTKADLYVVAGQDSVALGQQASDGSDEWRLIRDPEQVSKDVVQQPDDVTIAAGEDVSSVLPQNVTVTHPSVAADYTDILSAEEEAPVVWNLEDFDNSKVGEFTVSGKASVRLTGVDTTVPVSVKVKVTASSSGGDSGGTGGSDAGEKPSAQRATMYRLYNPNTGEHFYTASSAERDNLTVYGWKYEGVGWVAPSESEVPVYRLYNPNARGGDHHYTLDANERDMLVSEGWRYEGVGWYSDGAESVPVYREYNPNAASGAHNYTTNLAEHNALIAMGWQGEGIGWYALAEE